MEKSNYAEKLLTDLMVIPSFTQEDATRPQDFEACGKALDLLGDFARANGAHMVRRMVFEGNDAKYGFPVDNLAVRWRRNYGKQIPRRLCFIGHIDVVSIAGQNWATDPFGAVVTDGILYGRGATDMKGAVAAFFSAMKQVWDNGDYHEVEVIITSDEEWAAINGTRRVLEWMSKGSIKPDAYLVGEPSARKAFGDTIVTGRRGSLNGTIKIRGISGHTAMEDDFVNPYDALSDVLYNLELIKFEYDTTWQAQTNLEVTDTLSVGGGNTATIPSEVILKWNIRYTGNYTAEDLDEMVRNAMAGLGDNDLAVMVESNLDYASQPYLGNPGELLEVVQSVVTERFGEPAETTHKGGTSDGRFVQLFNPAAEVLEFGPPTSGGLQPGNPAYGKEGGMHKVNECISLATYHDMVEAYAAIIVKYCNYGLPAGTLPTRYVSLV